MWDYYRDEPSNPLSSNSESFKYKTCITENTHNRVASDADYDADKVSKNETEVIISLKHFKTLKQFWRTLNLPLTNCEIELILTWSKNCALADATVRAVVAPTVVAPAGLEFQIIDTKLYVPVVTLSKENDKKILEQLKSGFKRTVKWNKYRSQMTI